MTNYAQKTIIGVRQKVMADPELSRFREFLGKRTKWRPGFGSYGLSTSRSNRSSSCAFLTMSQAENSMPLLYTAANEAALNQKLRFT
jgi:hypothetical protein